MLNAKNINGGYISAVQGTQTYTNTIVDEIDAYSASSGLVSDAAAMFPILSTGTVVGNLGLDDTIGFTASAPVLDNQAYAFNKDDSLFMVTNYKVIAGGNAEIRTTFKKIALADDDLTLIINNGTIVNPNFTFTASFDEPEPVPTEAPTEKPTEKPTEPPVTLTDGFYIIKPDWSIDSIDANDMFSENTASSGEYMLSTTLTEGDKLKAVKVENGAITTWYPDGMDNEYTVDAAHAGEVTIYFRETYQSDWAAFGGYFYIDNGSTPVVPTEPTTPDDDTVTVYFTDALNWGSANIYYWNNGPAWPGTAMTVHETNTYGQTVYKATVPATVTGIIFNGGGKQTVDITSDITDGAQWYTTGEMDGSKYKVSLVGGTQPEQPTDPPTPTKTTLTLQPSSDWQKDGARFAAYFFGNGETWVSMTGSGNTYTVEVPDGYTSVIFCRMNPSSTTNNWNNKWNQTSDLSVQDGIGKKYVITGWDNSGHWE